MLEKAFAVAPLISLSALDGIRLHVDHGQSTYVDAAGATIAIPTQEIMGGRIAEYAPYILFNGLAVAFDPDASFQNFYDIKASFFNKTRRAEIFHYCVFASMSGHERGGSGKGEFTGNDFYVTLDQVQLGFSGHVAGVFMHELGHNLGLHHGGNDEERMEPNHQSVMSVYGNYFIAGVDIDCDAAGDGVYAFSPGMLKDLDESALLETTGTCNGVWVDFDADGERDEAPVAVELSDVSSADMGDHLLDDHDNWGNLAFDINWDEWDD